jgi:hypothetical protein
VTGLRGPRTLLVLLLAASCGAGPAFSAPAADVPPVGKGKHMGRKPLQPGAYFNDRSRNEVQQYYASIGQAGKDCPPGLAKKKNGCTPPGQARKEWSIGEKLPTTAVVAPVPAQLVAKLPPVPPGYRYVNVAGDILLVALGSKMVVDGISAAMR